VRLGRRGIGGFGRPARAVCVLVVLGLLALAGCGTPTPTAPARPANGAGSGLVPSGGRAVQIRAPLRAAADPMASLGAMACASVSSCVAGGAYDSRSGSRLALVVTESGGRWARARRLAMPANAVSAQFTGSQQVNSISCPRAGSCVAVGGYQTEQSSEGFFATGSGGTWGRARQLRLPRNASTFAPSAMLGGVSCWRAGWCVAVGGYFDSSLRGEAMLVTELGGRWGRAVEIATPAGASADPGASLRSVSCRAGGLCVAVGGYETSKLTKLGLALAGSPAHWRVSSIPLPAGAAVFSGLNFLVYTTVGCNSAGFCVAAGSYITRSDDFQAATARLAGRRWVAREMPVPPGAARDPMADLASVRCTTAFCEAVGWFTLRSGAELPMAIRRSRGSWGQPVRAGLPAGARSGASQSAALMAVACPRASPCIGAGVYLDAAGHQQAMVTTRLW
jgi:hypothetical protein